MIFRDILRVIYYRIFSKKFTLFYNQISTSQKDWYDEAVIIYGYYDAYLTHDFFPLASYVVVCNCDPLAMSHFLTLRHFPKASHIWIDKLPAETFVLDAFLALGVTIYTTPKECERASDILDPYLQKNLEPVPESIFNIFVKNYQSLKTLSEK